MAKKLDLIGQRFTRLEVLEEARTKKDERGWKCRCDCGNEIILSTRQLRTGNTKSCGCLHREMVSKQFSKDITNQRFGKLVAIEPTKERKHGSIIWKCQCDCGNIHYASTENLLGNNVQSCGCLHSRGNQKIKNILQQNNILFIPEYPIRINNINYYFDFALLKDNQIYCFIEYDGILHFEQDQYHGWNNQNNWERTQLNDKIKNQYCKDNNIKLIRIPYTDYDKLDITYIKERT